MSEMGMVERVAKALHGFDGRGEWSAVPERRKNFYRRMAEAAIGGMRNPPGDIKSVFNSYALCTGDLDRGWEAWIDAALG
jgi:hypothetical protein